MKPLVAVGGFLGAVSESAGRRRSSRITTGGPRDVVSCLAGLSVSYSCERVSDPCEWLFVRFGGS